MSPFGTSIAAGRDEKSVQSVYVARQYVYPIFSFVRQSLLPVQGMRETEIVVVFRKKDESITRIFFTSK